MSGSDETRPRTVALWLVALIAVAAFVIGAALGRSPLFEDRDPEVVVGEATLANDENGLTTFTSKQLDSPLDFDSRSVSWVDDQGVNRDGFGDEEPPCLQVSRPVRMEVSYVPLPRGGVVTKVKCLP